ncbi:serine/threonine-protein kinase SMG1 [Galendromus occidentalis]|uniref:non-specific serine/threonine protein kinase n=1 Tax=Galendromus occidentalis TaxID=34638 RepID=A0AAJ6VXL6_9ACAR|nr:serine/threonine-protein kinase SMG1 [Galendromus occidentalis]
MSGNRRHRNDDGESRQSSDLENCLSGLNGSPRYDRMTDAKIEVIHMNCVNTTAVRRVFQKHAMTLAHSLCSYLLNCPSDETSRSYVTDILAYVSRILIEDEVPQLQAYLEVLAKNVDMPGDLCKISILNAITKVSKYLWKNQMLSIGAETLLGTLYQMLEQTNNPAVLKPIIEGFLYYANDESIFSQYFMDVSDILIGWHVDGSAGQDLALFMASSLSAMAPYFSSDASFSVSLIKQFQEDIASFRESILKGHSDVIDKLCSIILVMTNIAIAVQDQVDIKVKAPELVQNLLAVQKYLDESPKLLGFLTEANVMCSSLFVLINDCPEDVCSFLTLQLNHAPRFKIQTRYLEGLLSLVSLVIGSGVEGEVLMKLMHSLFSPLGALYHLRANRNIRIQERFAEVCRDLLALKDVALVQGAFEHLRNDLRSSNVSTALAAVEALKGMAETRDSIIPILALRPSLFELLHSLVGDPMVEERVKPEILKLLRTHSASRGHFISTSDLIGPSTSISANYLRMVIELMISELPAGGYTTLYVLMWLEDLVSHTALSSSDQLAQSPIMSKLVKALTDFIIKQWKDTMAEKAMILLHKLLFLDGWTFSEEALSAVKQLGVLTSEDKEVVEAISLTGSTEDLSQRHEWTGAHFVGFKKFMTYVSGKAERLSNSLLLRLYIKSEGDGSSCVPCSGVLWTWLAWQSAHYLVHNKLKSYLGKPIETLGFVEAVLKSTLDEHRGIMILKFVDYLERCMYLASEGTVTVSNTFSKACRQFFHTNRSVCQEWLQRLRSHITRLALNRSQPHFALWQVESLFENKTISLNQDQLSFFASLYVRSAIELKAPNRLLSFSGFLSNTQKVSDSLGQWLKASALHAGQKFEVALGSYEKLKLKDNSILSEILRDQIKGCRKSLQVCEELVNWDEVKVKNFVSTQRKKSNLNLAFDALRKFEKVEDDGVPLIDMDPERRAAIRFDSGMANRQFSKLIHALDGWEAAITILSGGEVKDVRSLVTLAKLMQSPPDKKLESQSSWRVGMLLRQACKQQPDYAKAYFKFADWSYRCGKKDIESGDTQITATDQKLISDSLLPLGLHQLVAPMCSIIGRVEFCDSGSCGCSSKKQKISDMLPATLPPATLQAATDELYDIELRIQQRVFGHYHTALDSYFHFLKLSPMGSDATQVEATLRLLRLIVKHAHSLQDTLESNMSGNIVTEPWHAIIPQLFARLNHQEVYVRKTLIRLIGRIGETSLQLVAYPAIVGDRAAREDKLTNIRRLQQEESQELSQSGGDTQEDDGEAIAVEELDDTSKQSYAEICMALRQENHVKMSEIEVFVREMERISVLWEEKCITALTQHYAQLQQPGGHQTCLDLLRNLKALTLDAGAETPHEEWFQESFRSSLMKTVEIFQSSRDIDTLKKQYKSLCATLNNKIQEDIQSHLSMAVISPRLASLRNTVLPIPGQSGKTVSSVASTVLVLPTKSKPKKFSLIGNDGVRYTFLFKGLEDLHLDERIMQFISISNRILSKRFGQNSYLARSYAVTPMGRRSGLIQWIDQCVPLFTLYKRHQVLSQGYATRPTEMFYSKLIPKLNKTTIPTDKRREWPKQILVEVLEELTKETPGDLLLREIWAASASPAQFWARQNSLINSVAVTSMIGYIIGLGDRHLDNILLDVKSGHLIHIDYNVCFERGTQLRVAERVPFRLTPIVTEALGLNGLNGGFKVAAENILRTLRQNRETLLTLLEAFVYDPLVDWTVGGQASSKPMTSMNLSSAVKALIGNISEESFLQSLIKVEQELRAIWNVVTANVVGWCEHATLLRDKIELLNALQDCPTALDEVKSVQERFQLLRKLIRGKQIAGLYLTSDDPLIQIMAKFTGQTISLWHQWLTHVVANVDLQSVQQTLQRFHSKSIVNPETIIADLAYLTEQSQMFSAESSTNSLFYPRVIYESSAPIAARLIDMLDSFKIDIVPRLIAISDFDYVHSPLESLVGEGMELLSSMIATSDCDEIAEKLEAEYEALIAPAASLASPQQALLLELDSLFGELRFIEKLQLIHGLFSVLQTVPSGASRLAGISAVVENLVLPMLEVQPDAPTAEIPPSRKARDSKMIHALTAIINSTLDDPMPDMPSMNSVSGELADPDDIESKQTICETIIVNREAILEESMSACTILAEPSHSRIAMEGDLTDVTREQLIDETSRAVQELRIQTDVLWQPIGAALQDADVKLQGLVELIASVRSAEHTEFLMRNAQWPELPFSPVKVCFDTIGQFNNTCQCALRSFAEQQPETVDLQMVHEASEQIGSVYHVFEVLREQLQECRVVDLLESKGEDVRNRQGMQIWKKVKTKLDGQDFEKTKMSVASQLERVIQEATNVGNLALMYEGWTPWV